METHEITVGDTLTPLGAQLKQLDSNGDLAVVDLTSRSVKFKMVDNSGNVVVAETASNVSITDASNGKVQYDFQSTDVDTAGEYYAWFFAYNAAGTERDAYPATGEDLKIVIHAANYVADAAESVSSDDIISLAKGPRKMSTDEGTVTERSVDELIKADQYAKAQEISDSPLHGLRISRFKPGGPV